ncbi:GntG family PLP-dependent aldolase [Fulvivirgaceae bacterium BMA10]|uniref:GntG family PLP-dependent aldolase n=1 Tax=Splendidivirga corallicola TaxID=3051826 RepID=A0ABT8KJR9_9BACT|nr:GntG family PLP-dependent aldolase [Fulvivirgaceae bacterium BMA10]
MKLIDLRSDTVTRPGKEMLQAMMDAQVGDDVFDEDPTVKQLEEKAANLFGMEGGIFCPSGTMTNQIAIRISTLPQDEVICDHRAHIYNYEAGGLAYNSLVSVKLLDGDRGRFTADDVKNNVRPDDIHAPRTSLVSIENTMNKGGGSYYTIDQIGSIAETCRELGLNFHLDGARVFNALVETGESPEEYGQYFDTISICLSKGLGAPIGSLLLGTKEHMKKAKRVRKVLGGGMRQVGYLAAAGIYALDHHIDRLREDHQKARILGETLEALPYVDSVMPVDTNIVIFSLEEGISTSEYLAELDKKNIKAVPFGPNEIRFVTHLDFDDDMLSETVKSLRQITF